MPRSLDGMDRRDLRQSQLFLDDRWIAFAHRVHRVWQQAHWFPEPVLRPTEPWEGRQIKIYGSVVRDLGFPGFRCYYTTLNPPQPNLICMAQSDDGIHWSKPRLGLCEWQGSRDNNIILQTPRGNDGISLAYDAGAEYPYLLYYYMGRSGDASATPSIHVARSRDGIVFEHRIEPVLRGTGDHHYVMLHRVDGKITLICRHGDMYTHPGTRSIWLTQSDDGLHFPEPELVLMRDLLDPPLVEYYGMAAFPYGDLYIGLLEYWEQNPDRIEIVPAWSDDLRHWSLPPRRERLISAKFPWNERWNSNSSAGPISVGDQLWFYVGGRSDAHKVSHPHSYGAIGLATIKRDRFCSLTTDALEGFILTHPMTWPGGDLILNASTTRYPDAYPPMGGGSMSVEVLDADSRPLEGFSGANCAVFHGNEPRRGIACPPAVRWHDRSLDLLRGRTIRLRVRFTDAHLFSFRSSIE